MRFIIKIIIFYLFLFNIHVYSLNRDTYSKLRYISELSFNDQFNKAFIEIKKIQNRFPYHPVGYFYELAVIDKIQADYNTDYLENKFQKVTKHAKKIAIKYKKKHPKDAYAYFFLGGIQGYYALHQYRVNNDLSVFIEALSALNNLKKAKKLQPNLWDVYYGLGTYIYWKAEKASFMFLFGFNKNKNKNKGKEYLNLAALKGDFSHSEANGALIRILIHEKQFKNALTLINEQLKKYPQSVYLLTFRTKIYFNQQKWHKLNYDCIKLEKLLSNKSFTGADAWVYCYFFKGLSDLKIGNIQKSKNSFKAVLNISKIYKKKIKLFKKLVVKAKKLCKCDNENIKMQTKLFKGIN